MLDGLTPHDNPRLRIESSTTPGRCIEATIGDGGALTVTYSEDGAGVEQVGDADILAVHRAVLTCLGLDAGWRRAFAGVGGTFSTPAAKIDYRTTGLSIANALLDDDRRRERHGLPGRVPPWVRWGDRRVITGDTWRDLPARGTVTVRLLRADPIHEHGVSILTPGGTVGGERQLLVWSGAETVAEYVAPTGVLHLCNVFMTRGATWERIDRWSENAGMVLEPVTGTERIYHCNHASTAPPEFADLVFSVSLEPGAGGGVEE